MTWHFQLDKRLIKNSTDIDDLIQDMYEDDLSEMDFVDIILGDQENKPSRPELDNNLENSV